MSEPLRLIPYASRDEAAQARAAGVIASDEFRRMARVLLLLEQYEDSGNAFFLAQCYHDAVRLGYQPPRCAIEWVASGLGEILESKHEPKKLGAVLGLLGGRGQVRPEDARRMRFRDGEAMEEIARLIGWFGVSVERAAEMTSCQKQLAPETLASAYYRSHDRWRGFEEAYRECRPNAETDEGRKAGKALLSQYPKEVLPHELKERFSIR